MRPNYNEEKKPSIIWKGIKFIIGTLFPIFKIFSLNHNLTLCEKTLGKELKDKSGDYIPPYDWFSRQKRLNLLWGLGASLPMIIGVALSYVILSSNPIFIKGMNSAKNQIEAKKVMKGFGIPQAIEKMKIANKIDASVNQDIRISTYMILIGFFSSMVIGSILIYRHPLTQDTTKLRKALEQSGFIRSEENPMVFATEVGFLIDITGSVSREIADSDRIWTSLNVRVNRDVAENPEKRSLVFFKKAYELKKGNEYGFDKIPKGG